MKSNKIKGISPALIWENLKLGWYVPLIASILYFFSGIFPIITNYSQLDVEAFFIQNSLVNQNIGYLPLMILVPLIAAMLVMNYMHNPTKSLALHSQPYTRAKLYSSHVISGYLMCIIPILITTAFYFIFMKETYLYDVNAENNVYTAAKVLSWLVLSISITTFSYGLFVLAGSLSGNTFMHLALSGVFFCIIPVIIFTVNFYCDTFISGFVSLPDSVMESMVNSNPFIRIAFASSKEAANIEMNGLWYLLAGIIFLLLGFAACKKAKLEKVGDSFIFKAVEEVMTYLVVFVGMTIFGSLFATIGNSRMIFVVGLIAGALICFFTSKIIIARTARVFNKKNLVSLLVYTLLSGSFVALTVFDVAGLSDKVPNTSDIQSIESEYFLHDMYGDFTVHAVNIEDIGNEDNYLLNDEKYIELMTQLHKTICENDLDIDAYGKNDENTALPYESLQFNYKLKNGNDFRRIYGIRVDERLANILDKLTANEQFKKMNMYEDKIDWELEMYMLIYDANGSNEKLIKDKAKIKKFIETLDKDIYNKTYMEYYHETLKSIEQEREAVETENFYGTEIAEETTVPETFYTNIVFESGLYDDERLEISLYSKDLQAYKYIKEFYEN